MNWIALGRIAVISGAGFLGHLHGKWVTDTKKMEIDQKKQDVYSVSHPVTIISVEPDYIPVQSITQTPQKEEKKAHMR